MFLLVLSVNSLSRVLYRADFIYSRFSFPVYVIRDSRRIAASEIKCVGEINVLIHSDRPQKKVEIAKEPNLTPVLGKIQEYIRDWLQHIKRTTRV